AELRPPYLGAGEVSACERSVNEVRIGEVLAGEVAAVKAVVSKADAAQVVSPVTGGRIELRKRDATSDSIPIWIERVIESAEVRPSYVGAGEVGVRQRGGIEVCIGKILAGEVGAAQVVPDQSNACQIIGLVAGR